MTAAALGPRTLGLLKDSVLDLPKERVPGDFGDYIQKMYAQYLDLLLGFDEPVGSLLRARRDQLHALTTALVAAWRFGRKADWAAADAHVVEGLRGVEEELIRLSRRHGAKVLLGQSWYRLAHWQGVESRKHMFHVPFERPQSSYRFSLPGAPALYLANSVYLCWLECQQPDVPDCYVSRFEVDSHEFEFLDLSCCHQAYVVPLDLRIPGTEVDPRTVMNSPYADEIGAEIADYLTCWPILLAATVRKLEPAPEHPDEYVIPQLLMRWTQRSDRFLGIRFFTSKEDRSTNSQDWSVNLALPARMIKNSGYCDFLKSRVRCTVPERLSLMNEKSLQDLVTREAGDRRQWAMGRYMLQWPDHGLEEYSRTVFGKMEYWLDRPELQLAYIDDE
jgi:hypothetical protein